MSRRLLLVLVLAALAVAVTACGGSASNTYRSGVDAAQRAHATELRGHEQALAAAIKARKAAVAATEATAAGALVGAREHQVAALHPPASLRTRAERLLTAYRELVQSLDQIAAAFTAKKLPQANAAIDRYNSARLDESSAVAALNASGG